MTLFVKSGILGARNIFIYYNDPLFVIFFRSFKSAVFKKATHMIQYDFIYCGSVSP